MRHWLGVGVAAAVFVGGGAAQQRTRAQPHLSRSVVNERPADGPLRFREASEEAGLAFTHVSQRRDKPVGPNYNPRGPSVAVVDYDNDGRPDVYLTNSGPGTLNKLFRNNGDGTFTDVAEKVGLADLNKTDISLRALFFDFDNDGRRDLFLSGIDCPRLFRNEGKRFVEVTRNSEVACGTSWASNAVDYDGDGWLDLVVAYRRLTRYPAAGTGTFNWLMTFGSSHIQPGPVRVFRNERGRFAPAPGNLGLESRNGYVHAVGVYDLRGTGRPDLYFARGWAQDLLYFNQGGGRFMDGSWAVAQEYSLNGMSAEIADVDDDGRPLIYVTNIFEPGYLIAGNVVWKASPDGRFEDVGRARGVNRCGWGWGVKFGDFDNDGRQDAFQNNGMFSRDPKKDYWFQYATAQSASTDLMLHQSFWPILRQDFSFAGYQQDCVFRNHGSRFADVTDSAGVHDRQDGRGLALIDVLGDGRLSVVSGNYGGKLQFYRNERQADARWIGFSPGKWGAKVRLKLAGGRVMSRELQPANGYNSQSDERLHFGLGEAAVESAEVLWPSGKVTVLQRPRPGRYHAVKEPG